MDIVRFGNWPLDYWGLVFEFWDFEYEYLKI